MIKFGMDNRSVVVNYGNDNHQRNLDSQNEYFFLKPISFSVPGYRIPWKNTNNSTDLYSNNSIVYFGKPKETLDAWHSGVRQLGSYAVQAIGTLGTKAQSLIDAHPEEYEAWLAYSKTIAEDKLLTIVALGQELGIDPKRTVESIETANLAFREAGQELHSLLLRKSREYGLNNEDRAGILSFGAIVLSTSKVGRGIGSGKTVRPRPHMPDPHMKYYPPPKKLNGFPEASRDKAMTPQQGDTGPRKRWRLPDGKILEWDRQHGELEMYNKTGRQHLGSYDPTTGKQLKPSESGRNISKYVN